ncbi:MAG TPA: response regulator [Opitutaceae bacterium]|jgi:CheY-like chemotaxis protein
MKTVTRKLTILVAEDDRDDFFFLHRMLNKANVGTVHHVENGQQAIDYLAGNGCYRDRAHHPFPDVLLLDLKLPIRSGQQVLEWLGLHRLIPRPAIYVLSGSSSETEQRRAEKAGAIGFFLKPLSLGHLAALVDQVPVAT